METTVDHAVDRRTSSARRVGAIVAAAVAAALAGCDGLIVRESGSVDLAELEGAGGRDITEYWPSIDVPLSQTTRMLSFEMMRNEVARATGHSWVVGAADQWEPHRAALGGADYRTTFTENLIPSQQRIGLWRRMAYQVCGDLIAAEAGAASRAVFVDLDPAAPIDPTAPATASQIRHLFGRFFLADAEDVDVREGTALLRTLSPVGSDGNAGWLGLCVAYLGSMRFLTY